MSPLHQAEPAPPYYPGNDQPLIAFRLSHAVILERFGPAHRQMTDGDNEPGPCEYWSFEFLSGLRVFIVYHFSSPGGPSGDIYATPPNIEYILEHVPVADCVFWRLDHAEPEFWRQRYGTNGC